MEDKSKIIKFSFLLFMISLITVLFFVNEVVMDYVISLILRYFYYPSFASIIITLIMTMAIFINNIFDDDVNDKKRIINYIFSCFIFISYIILMLQDIDINSAVSLYQGNNLIALRYISRTFILWMMVNLLIKYFNYFLKKDN